MNCPKCNALINTFINQEPYCQECNWSFSRKVKLYNREKIIGYVDYNAKLDTLIDKCWQNGGKGYHLGFGIFKNKFYYLIFGTDWKHEEDKAIVVRPNEIIAEAIKSNNISKIKPYKKLVSHYIKYFKNKDTNPSTKVFAIRVNYKDKKSQIDAKIEHLIKKIDDYMMF